MPEKGNDEPSARRICGEFGSVGRSGGLLRHLSIGRLLPLPPPPLFFPFSPFFGHSRAAMSMLFQQKPCCQGMVREVSSQLDFFGRLVGLE